MGKQELRPKNEGAGIMKSVFVDEYRGFGCPMSREELRATEQLMVSAGLPKERLSHSPAVVSLRLWSDADEYWDADQMAHQLERFVLAHEVVHPGTQLIVEMDQSSNHLARKKNGLSMERINKSWGGKQREMRPSVMTAGCLGPNAVLKVGDRQVMQFTASDRPHFTPNAPLYDRDMSPPERVIEDARVERLNVARAARIAKQAAAATSDRVGPSHEDEDADEDDDDEAGIITPNYIVPGFVGKPKGWAQILWERGLFKEGMVARITEKSEQQRAKKGLAPRGHVLLISPVCHPELAGVGIEYDWGVTKYWFRRTNDCKLEHLEANVERVSSEQIIGIDTVWRFSRRTREYARAYTLLSNDSTVTDDSIDYNMIERM
eukprot:gene29312-36339_t